MGSKKSGNQTTSHSVKPTSSTDITSENPSPEIGGKFSVGDSSIKATHNPVTGKTTVEGKFDTPVVDAKVKIIHDNDGVTVAGQVSKDVSIGNPDFIQAKGGASANASINQQRQTNSENGTTTTTTVINAGVDVKADVTLANNSVGGKAEIIDITLITSTEVNDITGETISRETDYEFESDLIPVKQIRQNPEEFNANLDEMALLDKEIAKNEAFLESLQREGAPNSANGEISRLKSELEQLRQDRDSVGQGNDATIDSPEPDLSGYHNDQTLRDFLNDPDYNQHLASNEGGGIAGDYEKYLQEQVADWDDDGDGRLSAEEREFRDDLNNFAKHNEQNAASQSDSDAAMHESERGEGEHDPDSIVGFVDGKPVTASEAGLVADPDAPINQLGSGPGGSAGINPTWGGNDLNNDGIVSDAELLNLQKSAIQSGMRGVNDLYNAIDGGDWLGVVDSGLDVAMAIDRYLDTGTDALGGGSEGFISEDMEQSNPLFISWNAPRNEAGKRTLPQSATRSLRFLAKSGAAELTRTSLKQSSRLSVLSCDARRL